MRRMPKGLGRTFFCGFAILVLGSLTATASDLASINGRVQDSSGGPVVGALVIVSAASPVIPERIALTDRIAHTGLKIPELAIQVDADALRREVARVQNQ